MRRPNARPMTFFTTLSVQQRRYAPPSSIGPAQTPGAAQALAMSKAMFSGAPVLGRLGKGVGFTGGVIEFFNKVNTSFFYQLFLMDFIALFVTRVSSALVIGRDKYDALSDQLRHTRNGMQQQLHQLGETMKGLNWDNAKEAVVREGLTAPGCLLLPSLAFLATQKLLGGQAQEIKQRNFNALYDGLMTHLQQVPESNLAQTNKALLSQLLDATHNPELAKLKALSVKAGDSKAIQQFKLLPRSHQLKQLVIPEALLKNYGVNNQLPQTIGEFLDQWKARWVAAVDAQHAGVKPEVSLTQLTDDLDRLFHKHVLPVTSDKPLKRGVLNMGRFVRNSAESGHIQGEFKVIEQPIQSTLKNLSRFTDFVRQTYRQAAKAGGETLLHHATQARHTLMHHKFFTTLVGLAISAGWLYLVPKLSQSHDKYPAIRHFKEALASSVKNPNSEKAQALLSQQLQVYQQLKSQQNNTGVYGGNQ